MQHGLYLWFQVMVAMGDPEMKPIMALQFKTKTAGKIFPLKPVVSEVNEKVGRLSIYF